MEVTLGNHRQADFDRFERAIRDIPEIVACWSVGGGVDYVLKMMARDIDAYQRLVDAFSTAKSASTAISPISSPRRSRRSSPPPEVAPSRLDHLTI